MNSPFKTVLIGSGMMGAGFANDPMMAKFFQYASHSQVLAAHPLFSWEAVVDKSDKALKRAADEWRIPVIVKSVDELAKKFQPEVAVIATPPQQRIDIIKKLPTLRAVLVEKPLGLTLTEALEFIEECDRRGIIIQVNFWRRGDEVFRTFAEGELEKTIGRPLAAFGLYGNGLMNNGSHMVDLGRMLFGEISRAEVLSPQTSFTEGPIPGDKNITFLLCFETGLNVLFQAITFVYYRENSLDIWGKKGRLGFYQESLGIYKYPRTKNRAITGEWEIASDMPKKLDPTCGMALYHMYDNIVEALINGTSLWSSGEEALKTEKIVHQLLEAD
ncbi:Gfo/Idh/MocA family protein [Thermodesulfobacteriota bacterium]